MCVYFIWYVHTQAGTSSWVEARRQFSCCSWSSHHCVSYSFACFVFIFWSQSILLAWNSPNARLTGQWFPGICLSSSPLSPALCHHTQTPPPIFWVGSGGSNLSPLSCKASTLLRGLSSNTILISELKPFTYLFMVLAIKTRAKWVWQSDMSMTTVQSKLKLLCIHKNGVKIHLITLLAFLIFIFIHLCICVYFCVCLQCVCRCPWRPGNVFGSPGARVKSPA